MHTNTVHVVAFSPFLYAVYAVYASGGPNGPARRCREGPHRNSRDSDSKWCEGRGQNAGDMLEQNTKLVLQSVKYV